MAGELLQQLIAVCEQFASLVVSVGGHHVVKDLLPRLRPCKQGQ
jgi:hypothetical protein